MTKGFDLWLLTNFRAFGSSSVNASNCFQSVGLMRSFGTRSDSIPWYMAVRKPAALVSTLSTKAAVLDEYTRTTLSSSSSSRDFFGTAATKIGFARFGWWMAADTKSPIRAFGFRLRPELRGPKNTVGQAVCVCVCVCGGDGGRWW